MELLTPATDAAALTRRLSQMIDAGHTGAARPLLAAVRRLAPPSADLAQLAARLALRDGKLDQAQDELDRAVEDAPGHAGLRRHRAELRRMTGDAAGAVQDAAEAVILDRANPEGKALLGVLLADLGRFEEAVSCLREALSAAPANPAIYEALAQAERAGGNAEAAAATLAAGIAALPGRVDLRNAAILLAVRRHDFTAAVDLAEAARRAGVADACLFGLKGHALSSLGRHDEAGQAYVEALKLGPDDPYVRHLVAASGIIAGADRAPADYVRTVFDGYAERFEGHLISLGYRIPGVIRGVLPRYLDASRGPVLDLGCGSGLIGVALSDLPIGKLIGVDLSPRMLAQAAAKGLYAELHEADLQAMLAEESRAFPIVIAADVMCYFGDLTAVLASVHARLAPGGVFVFSVEALQPDASGALPAPGPGGADWALGRAGRYAHASAYVERAAQQVGFLVREIAAEVVRNEAEAPVAGLLLVLERPRHAG